MPALFTRHWRRASRERTIAWLTLWNIDAMKFSALTAKGNMNDSHKPKAAGAQSPAQGPAYSTFPRVTTHGPRDKRCFHGKPEDWQRAPAKRTFGEKVK